MSLAKTIAYPGPEHDKIQHALWMRYEFSKRYMTKRYDKWREAEDMHIAYVNKTMTDEALQASRKSGNPQYTTIKIPYSYAMLLSAHTYWTTVFLSRDPVIQLQGRHGETEQRTQAIEAVLSYQNLVGQHMVPYYVWLFDVGKYGLGIIGQYWDEEVIQSSQIVEEQDTYNGIPIIGKKVKRRIITRVPGYSGMKLYNVRPFDWYPDPRVPIQRFQDGEFCGRVTTLSWPQVLKRAALGIYFNIDELKKRVRTIRINEAIGSPHLDYPAEQNTLRRPELDLDMGFVEIMEMYVEIIPKMWGLGSSEYPEKWVFTAADLRAGYALIIGCQPFGEFHDKFPFAVLENEVDGYVLAKRGMYDILEPLQNTMDWLFNSHFYNVRRALNDVMVIDPSRVNYKDFLEEQPGTLARLLPAAYGSDVRTVASQFAVADITKTNLNDATGVADLMQRACGVTDQIMGLMNMGGRRSATEVRQANAFGVNRLKTQAEYFSAAGWTPHASMLIQSTQQHFNSTMKLRIAGSLMGSKTIDVTPEEITGNFDFVPIDGNLPIDRFAQVTMWTQLLSQMRQFPAVMAEYDVPKIFSWVSQLAGLKNINQFKVQVAPDQALQEAAAKGEITPLLHPLPSYRPTIQDIATGNA